MKTVTRWSCMGGSDYPDPTPCDAHGTTDREAEAHCKAASHTTVTIIRPLGDA